VRREIGARMSLLSDERYESGVAGLELGCRWYRLLYIRLGHKNMGLGDLEGVTRLAMDEGTLSRG
jgi:hypothetical protein